MRLFDGARSAHHHRYIQALTEQAALGTEGDFCSASICGRKVLQKVNGFYAGMSVQAGVDVQGLNFDIGCAGHAFGLANDLLGLIAYLLNELIKVVSR
ncbi:hypothetical protein D3C75_1147780 [compost metagenome]